MIKKHFEVTLHGKVQGIGLRYLTKERADQFKLWGYARNTRDNGLFIVIEGSDTGISELLNWLKSNPGLSQVDTVKVTEGRIEGFRNFEVF